jgi:hypothetical protein
MGLACDLDLASSDQANRVIVADTFTSNGCVQVFLTGLSTLLGPLAEDALDIYALGTATDGVPGNFAICWGSTIRHLEHEPVYVGMLALLGPDHATSSCTLSIPCSFSVSGFGLTMGDGIILARIAGMQRMCQRSRTSGLRSRCSRAI